MRPLSFLFGCFLAAGALGSTPSTQDVTEVYVLEDVWLLPSVSHPNAPAQVLSGSFAWTYDPAEPENGSGVFTELSLPWYGSNFSQLSVTVESKSIEITLPGNFHGLGVDISLFLLPQLDSCKASPIDLSRSTFNIEVGVSHQGVMISGSALPDCLRPKNPRLVQSTKGSSLGTPQTSSLPILGAVVADSGAGRALPTSLAPRYFEVPGERRFSGRMIVRPLQPVALKEAGLSPRLAQQSRGAARGRIYQERVLNYVPQTDEYIIQISSFMDEQACADSLMSTGLFQYAEPDWLLLPTGSPAPQQGQKSASAKAPQGPATGTPFARNSNDPLLRSQWHHDVIQSRAAWALHTGSPSITIGMCDTGILATHEDLQGPHLEGYNAVDRLWESEGGDIGPRNRHGTRTTTVAAGAGNNGLGVSGGGWNLSYRMLRVSNQFDGGAQLSDLQHAVRTSIENGDRVANVSYHGAISSSNGATASYIKSIGGLMLWGSGNNSANYSSPDRDLDDLIVVGATDPNDALASFSAYGRFVDLFAPGTLITTATSSSDTAYVTTQGTSYACPMAASVCAMIWSLNPDLSPNDVEFILKQSADDIGLAGVDDTFGHGRINMYRALSFEPSLPPVSSFTRLPINGVSPLPVAFRDQSVGMASSWLWDFGDGTTSTLQNPAHTYASSGDYSVSLSVTNALGEHTFILPSAVVVDVIPPVASFSGTPLGGLAPLNVSFSDDSSGGVPDSWLWDFGDGQTSILENPSHTYTSSGFYDVSLTLGNAYGSDSLSMNQFVAVDFIPPFAGYSATPLSGASPLLVQFSDESTAGIATGWLWNFGDGQSSTLQNPAHTYTLAGTYNTSLTASNAYGSNKLVILGQITILPGPTILSNFVGSPLSGTAPLQVDFTDLSVGNITQWDWNFGDGVTSNLQNPTHVFATSGEYDINLTVTNASGKDSSLELGSYVVVQ